MTVLVSTEGLQAASEAAAEITAIQWAVAAGTVNAVTAVYPETVTSLTDGLALAFRASGANTSTTPTFAPDGLTSHTIVKNGGAPLLAGDLAAGHEAIVRYNLSDTRWELLNPVLGGLTAETAYTPTVTAATGAITAYTASGRYRKLGTRVFFDITFTITTNGTGAGSISVSLPFQTARGMSFSGCNVSTAAPLGVVAYALSTSVAVVKADGTYPGVTGRSYAISGSYDTV